ncbi:MAG: hypothetical protein IID41_06455, partial [Planctomycetes bacterium]|nr:hypothetical protein [Planctomycetota bacterium]
QATGASPEARSPQPGARSPELVWDDLSDPAGVDAQLKIIGAGSLVLCGLAVMWLNTMAAGFGHLYSAALETFHWTRLTLGLLVTILIGMYVALPLMLVGIAFNCAQRVALLHTRRLLIALAGVCVGGSAGLMIWLTVGALSPATVTQICALLLLFAGVIQLQPSDPARLRAMESSAVPHTVDRWGFVLPWMLRGTGFLVVYHLMLWLQIGVMGQARLLMLIYVCGVSVGLVTANFSFSRMLWPLHRLAILCMLVALSVAAVIVCVDSLHGWVPVPTGGQAAGGTPGWHWAAAVVVPALLSGMVLGAAASATVERSARAAAGILSSTLSICTGAGLACAAAMLGLTDLWPVFDQLVMLVLLWLAMGGLLLIYEPHFNLKSRRPHVAFMIASLLLVTVTLPRSAAAWTAGSQDLARSSMGSYRVISNASEADRYIRMLVAGKVTAAPTRFEPTGVPLLPRSVSSSSSHAVDSIIQQLILSKQRHSVVALRLPAFRWWSLRPKQQRGLITAAVQALRPDGTFVMRLTAVPPKHGGLLRWRQRVEEAFGQAEFAVDEIVSGDAEMREWVLLASNRPPGEIARGQPANFAARE